MIERLTISLPGPLRAQLEADVRAGRAASRSAIIVSALETYYLSRVADRVREETIASYRARTEEERAEDEAIVGGSRRAAAAVLRKATSVGRDRRARGRRG